MVFTLQLILEKEEK